MTEDKNKRELLAEYAHDAWSRWMSYLFYKSDHNEDGTVTIPKLAVERWSRQACTKYDSLPESEKTSDRDEADSMLKSIQSVIDDKDYRIVKLKAACAINQGTIKRRKEKNKQLLAENVKMRKLLESVYGEEFVTVDTYQKIGELLKQPNK